MNKVSVIVPIYNGEKTIKKCVDSIIAQTLDDIEIILVDDGSKDFSGKNCDEYANLDKRIKVVHKENGGLVSARKAGLKKATGLYVGYVDCDDWIDPVMYERLYDIAVKDEADMVCSGYILEGNYISNEYDSLAEGCYREEKKYLLDHLIFHMVKHDLGLRGSLCCKLFRRESFTIAQNRIPDEISYSEDKLCTLTYALDSKCVSVTKNAWYHYVMNASSMTKEPNPNYLNQINRVYQYLISLYSHPDFTDEMRRQSELYITQLLIKGINSRMGFSVPNLMWIDREWMNNVPDHSSILLYGKGALCETYARQIENSDRLRLIGCINEAAEAAKYEYDQLIITYKYESKAKEIREALIKNGIPDEKIRWFPQEEIFWKYAEDAGLCKVYETD